MGLGFNEGENSKKRGKERKEKRDSKHGYVVRGMAQLSGQNTQASVGTRETTPK